MKFKVLLFSFAVGLFLLGEPVLAHHSFMVEYDMTKPVTVKGVVTKIEYENPHISFFIDVKDEVGRITNWGFEAASPTALRAHGWTRDSIKPGDYVIVDAFRARNGTPFAAAKTLTLPNGRRLFAASDGVPVDR
jgi:hypothetical protein